MYGGAAVAPPPVMVTQPYTTPTAPASMFDMLDRNHDGRISRAEFNQMMAVLGNTQVPTTTSLQTSYVTRQAVPMAPTGTYTMPQSPPVYTNSFQTQTSPVTTQLWQPMQFDFYSSPNGAAPPTRTLEPEAPPPPQIRAATPDLSTVDMMLQKEEEHLDQIANISATPSGMELQIQELVENQRAIREHINAIKSQVNENFQELEELRRVAGFARDYIDQHGGHGHPPPGGHGHPPPGYHGPPGHNGGPPPGHSYPQPPHAAGLASQDRQQGLGGDSTKMGDGAQSKRSGAKNYGCC